jgi:hypothetical protein
MKAAAFILIVASMLVFIAFEFSVFKAQPLDIKDTKSYDLNNDGYIDTILNNFPLDEYSKACMNVSEGGNRLVKSKPELVFNMIRKDLGL